MRVLLWFFKESGQSGFYVVVFVSFRLYTLHSWRTLHSYILKTDRGLKGGFLCRL